MNDGVGLFNAVGGTVPSCVWGLRNLSVLHLTGNGLTGEIARSLPLHSQIADLSLSHNQLSGSIPLDILNIASLDLSYNQLSGEYDASWIEVTPHSNISLEINRLSGQLPVAGLERVSNGSLSVLHGNLFGCNSIPENDAYSRDYVYGSRNLNYSLFVLLSACGVAVVLTAAVCWAHLVHAKQHQHWLVSAVHSRCVLLWTYLTFLKHWQTHHPGRDTDSNSNISSRATAIVIVPPADVTSVSTTSRTSVTAPLQPSGKHASTSTSNIADENRNTMAHFALTALAEEYIPLFDVLATSFWLLVWSSAIFVSLLSWDIAMDEVGWSQSVWVPLVPLCYCVVLRCAAHLFIHINDSRDSTQGCTCWR